MSTPQSFSFVLCTIIIFSCSSKKQNAEYQQAIILQSDTVQVLPDESVDITQYNNAFEKNNTQIFTVSPQKISVLSAKKGLKVTVDPGVLEKEDGSAVDGKIKVNIIELTNIDELFKSNAATTSNGRLLASGGSYFIGMECKGQKLQIKKGRYLQMQFPKLKDEEMELFYGERNLSGNMNWIQAGNSGSGKLYTETITEKEIVFTDDDRYRALDYLPGFMYDDNKKPRIYKTLNDPVYYYEKKMTIKDLVDTINRSTAKIYIDTINAWPEAPVVLKKGQYIDTNYLLERYGPRKQFKLLSCQFIQEEAERLEKARLARQVAVEQWQPQTLSGQLQKYYSPSKITSLGWINCDRFYDSRENAETYFDLPVTFNKGSVHYFLMFRSINGLINGKVNIDSTAISFGNLPVGQKTTMVAFTKSNGKVFHCKQEFVVEKSKSVKLDFKPISEDEMKKIFGKNLSM